MTTAQKITKYVAIALAAVLIVAIIGGIAQVIVAVAGFFLGSDGVTDEMTVYPVSDPVTSLTLDINAADITLQTGDSFSVESNLKYLTVEVEDGCLILRDRHRNSIFGGENYSNAILTLTVPADFSFEKVNLATGAGRVTADCLIAAHADFSFGAGEVSIATLTVTGSIRLEGGAGKIEIQDGAIHDLDADLGIGETRIASAFTGDCRIDCGVGETVLTVIGSRDFYSVRCDKGIGSASLDGEPMENEKTYGTGEEKITVEGGIGAIKIVFESRFQAR